MERIVAGLQQRRVVSDREKRILAYHEGGHAVMSHLVGDLYPAQKATIVSRGQALGYTFNTPAELEGLVREYLPADQERKRISLALADIAKAHTFTQRVDGMMRVLQEAM